jgi:hypothetical protein
MTAATALKVYLRVLDIHRTTLRVVTLRPQTATRFSTNYFHDTWHILAGTGGAVLLGRLLWGLAFQRYPGTVILIDDPHLVPTPFEADPPDPILLVPAGLTRIDDDLLRALKLRLRRAPGSPTTIRWHTFGMPAALADDDARPGRWRGRWRDPGQRALWSRERMSRRAGFVCYTAPAEILRSHALGIYQMHAYREGYHPLAEHGARQTWGYNGEFQLIPDFADDVSAARVARRELLAREADVVTTDDDRWAIYSRKTLALQRLRDARVRPPRRGAQDLA